MKPIGNQPYLTFAVETGARDIYVNNFNLFIGDGNDSAIPDFISLPADADGSVRLLLLAQTSLGVRFPYIMRQ